MDRLRRFFDVEQQQEPGMFRRAAQSVGNAVSVSSHVSTMFDQGLLSLQRESTRANPELSDFTDVLKSLLTQLTNANSREQTLWSIIEVQKSIDALLNGNEGVHGSQIVIDRLKRWFQVHPDLLLGGAPHPPGVKERKIIEIIEQLRILNTELKVYREILEGKVPATQTQVLNQRNLLLYMLDADNAEGFNPLAEPGIQVLRVTEATYGVSGPEVQTQLDEIAEGRGQKYQHRQYQCDWKDGVFTFFNEVKLSRQGKMVTPLDSLLDTAIASTARKASELFFKKLGVKPESCLSSDNIDLPPLELVRHEVVDERGDGDAVRTKVVIQKKNLMKRPMSIGRLTEIFTDYAMSGKKQGMYEIWGKGLVIYFNHLIKHLKEEKAKFETRPGMDAKELARLETTLNDVERSHALLERTLDCEHEPSVETFQATFQTISRYMNDHPMIILHGLGELEMGTLLKGDAHTESERVEKTVPTIRQGIAGAQREEASTIGTPEQEQAFFHKQLDEAGFLGHLYSLYAGIVTLLGGNTTSRIDFAVLFNSIPKTDSQKKPLSQARIRELFEEQLRIRLIDASGDVWIFKRWLIKLIALPLLSWGTNHGVKLFVDGAKQHFSKLVEEMDPAGDGDLAKKTLDRVSGAATAITEVVNDHSLRGKSGGEPDIFRRGLFTPEKLDTETSDQTKEDIYASFTRNAVDYFAPQPIKIVEGIDKLDSQISQGIDVYKRSFVRVMLSVASLAVRIPLFAVRVVVMPIQYAGNWIVLTGVKKFLVWIGIVEKAMTTTVASLQKDASKQTVVTPIIDRSVLEMLDTLWQSLHTDDSGDIVDTESIDFTKFDASEERRIKQKKALSAVFGLIGKIEAMKTSKDKQKKAPAVGTLLDFLEDRGMALGIDACSDVAVAAFNTLTQPKMIFHMLSTALGAVNASMKATGTEVEEEEDEDLRGQIHEKVKQLIALSIHRAGDVLQDVDPHENEKLAEHVRGIKTMLLGATDVELPGDMELEEAPVAGQQQEDGSYENLIQQWKDQLAEFAKDPTDEDNFANFIKIRSQILSVWKRLQKDIVSLEYDKDTGRAVLNIHKRRLQGVLDSLLAFQNEYLAMSDDMVRHKLLEMNQKITVTLEAGKHNTDQIRLLLENIQGQIEGFRRDKKVGDFSVERVASIKTNLDELETLYRELKGGCTEEEQTDGLRQFILTAENNLFFLKELHSKLEAYKSSVTFIKNMLGEQTCELSVARPSSMREALEIKFGSEVRSYYNNTFRPQMRLAFPDYKRAGTHDQKLVAKIEATFKILEGLEDTPELSDIRESHITNIEMLLKKRAEEDDLRILKYITQGQAVTDSRSKLAGKELVRTTEIHSKEPGALKEKVSQVVIRCTEQLDRLGEATGKLTEVSPIHFNPAPDMTTVPFLRTLLQTANTELQKKVMALYSEVASNPDIATFLTIRLLLTPFNKAAAGIEA